MFNHVREGGIIYVKEHVYEGSWSRKILGTFWVVRRVGKVTPKRFTVGHLTYEKATGKCINKTDKWSPSHEAMTLPPEDIDFEQQRVDRDALVNRYNLANKFEGLTYEMLEDPDILDAATKLRDVIDKEG